MSRSSAASRPSSADSSVSPPLRWFEARIAPAIKRAGELPFVAAVSEALPWSFIALAAAFLAVLALQWRSGAPAGASVGLRLAAALLPGFGVMAGALTVLLALAVARRTGYSRGAMLAGSVAGFLLALPRPFGPDPVAYLRAVGAAGLFIAILACGLTAGLIAVARRASRSRAADWAGAAAAAGTVALLVAFGISPSAEIAGAMAPISRLGDSYLALMTIVLIETLLWTAGVHGPAVLAAVVTPVYLTMQTQNTHAYAAHAPLPYVVVVSLFLFVFPGGAGATLPLAFMLAFSRVPRLRRIGRITILPGLFNINDPLLVGAPVVFNPYFVVPFVGAPLVLATLTYAAVASGAVARAAFYVPSAVPAPLAVFLATLDVRAIVLLLVNVAVAGVIYYPFVRAYERHLTLASEAAA